jgi:hypothetical protein
VVLLLEGPLQPTCRRCRQPIGPDERVVVVTNATPATWFSPAATSDRLAYAVGKWHWGCTPENIRPYLSTGITPAQHDQRIVEALGRLVRSLGADRGSIWTTPADRPGALIARHIYTEPGISPPYPVIEPNYALRLREAVRTNGFVRFSNRTELPGVDAMLNFAEVRSGIFVQAPCGGAVGVTTTRASKFWDDRHVASVREATRGLCAGACGLTAP